MSGTSSHFLKRVGRQIKRFVFPPLCFHCTSLVEGERRLLCPACLEHLTLLDPTKRCPVCFSKKGERQTTCGKCPPQYLKLAAVFEYEGPIVSLIHHFKYGRRFHLARALAPFLGAQLASLEWPYPDLLVPIPQTSGHRLIRGYNPSLLLAREMGKLLKIPVASLLKRRAVSIPQSALKRDERLALSVETFQWRIKSGATDKTILLIDDVCTTGSTLRLAAERLKEGFPAGIYGLALSYVDS